MVEDRQSFERLVQVEGECVDDEVPVLILHWPNFRAERVERFSKSGKAYLAIVILCR